MQGEGGKSITASENYYLIIWQIFLMSPLIEDMEILMSASTLSLLQFVTLIKAYEGIPALYIYCTELRKEFCNLFR